MEKHAKHSPSQLHRIIDCPGSVKQSEGEPNETSSYAEEGTMLHNVMEKSAAFSHMLKGIEIIHKDLTKEQLRACENAADYVTSVYRECALKGDVEVMLEGKTSLAYLDVPTCYGIADVKFKVADELHILDYKFGQGVEVFVKDNPQFMAYGLGSFGSVDELMNTRKIVTHVVQPRLDNYYAYTYTPTELLLWLDTILKPALTMAETSAPCYPGVEQCRWCLGKMKCKARFDMATEVASNVFAVYAQAEITDDDLLPLMKNAKMLEGYIKDIKSHALRQCINGKGFPGHKAVLGRSSRHWIDEKAAIKFLIAKSEEGEFEFDELYESKFLTPPKAEKLTKALKKDPEFVKLYHKALGKPTLASESDPREAYAMNATSTFAQYAKE